MFSLKVAAFATTQISMFLLIGMILPNLFNRLSTKIEKRLEEEYERDAPSIWLQRLSSALEWFAKLVANPPEWLWPVSILGFMVSATTFITPLGGLFTIVGIVIGYRKPEWFDWISDKEKNFFRGPRWWTLIHPPLWLKASLVIVVSLVLGTEIHPAVVPVIGFLLTAATLQPERLDKLGSWNIARAKWLRFVGIVMFLLGIGWTIHSFKFETIVVIGTIGYFAIKHVDLVGKLKSWLQPATR